MDVFGRLEASADDFTRDISDTRVPGIICPSDCVPAGGRAALQVPRVVLGTPYGTWFREIITFSQIYLST